MKAMPADVTWTGAATKPALSASHQSSGQALLVTLLAGPAAQQL